MLPQLYETNIKMCRLEDKEVQKKQTRRHLGHKNYAHWKNCRWDVRKLVALGLADTPVAGGTGDRERPTGGGGSEGLTENHHAQAFSTSHSRSKLGWTTYLPIITFQEQAGMNYLSTYHNIPVDHITGSSHCTTYTVLDGNKHISCIK